MYITIFTLIMILLDILTGVLKSIKNKEFNSTKLRKGGINKATEILVLVFGFALSYGLPQFNIDIGFDVSFLICGYLFLMEATSIIENVGEINPNLIPPKISNFFKKL